MRTRKSMVIAMGTALAAASMIWAQDSAQTKIQHVPIKQTSPASGAEMYKSYCAACHGVSGRGDGPAAEALKVPPTDLTALATNNGGKYPSLKVAAILRGENPLKAHGTKDMPIWGNLFWGLSGGHEGEVQQRISNLNKYLESIQKK
jgi:mono/diheme cytochrome c family protein